MGRACKKKWSNPRAKITGSDGVMERWSNEPTCSQLCIVAILQNSNTPLVLESDWMPGRFHFDGVEDPIGIFGFLAAPHFLRQVAARIAFHVQFATAL